MPLPPELIREILGHILDAGSPDPIFEQLGVSTKQSWSLIEPITVACKAYRVLALEFWFNTLFVKSPSDLLVACDMFPEIRSKWTRTIHCVQADTKETSIWNFRGFKFLAKIRLDWLSLHMMPHYGSEDPADRLPFTNVTSLVSELDIRGLPWPSPLVFHNIGGILPDLQVLRMRQPKIWCGLCHTCSVARFSSPGPKALIYENGLGLPMHYARMLRTLSRLHTVYLTVADFGEGRTKLSDGSHENRYLWAGECDRCMWVMYDDEAFRDRWVARKQGIVVKGRETEPVYVRPPALKRVEWRFWSAAGEEDIEFLESGDELSGSGEDA